jgi:serine/threonine protein kinase
MQTSGESGRGAPASEVAPSPSGNAGSSAIRGRSLASRFADPLTGSVIAGKYRVERAIGEGAMGVVLAARHVELDEPVAIKCIRPALHGQADVLSRFAREAKACARLNSDHVVKVLDIGVAPPIGPFMVMEYLEGQDLATLLHKHGPLPARKATEYVLQVCEALALAHAHGITHRDIKPENLFLTRRGTSDIVKVLDFGISKAAMQGRVFGGDMMNTDTSCLLGTPLYMSPEQIRATHDVDHRTDLWSLGVVLYELLTGKPVFSGNTVAEVCSRVLLSKAPNLAEHCHTAPLELARVIGRCLMKDPSYRYRNAAELANALLPFAPLRARLHAERANSVMRDPLGADSVPPPNLLPPISVTSSAPTVFAAEPSVTPPHRAPHALVVALACLFALSLGFAGVRAVRPRAPVASSQGDRVAHAAAGVGAPPAHIAAGLPTERPAFTPATSSSSARAARPPAAARARPSAKSQRTSSRPPANAAAPAR